MHELVIAQVDAHVGEGAAHGVEEDEVAGLEFVDLDLLAHLSHFGGGARHAETQRIGENLADEAAAVEAGYRAGAAKTVGNAEEVEAAVDEGTDGIGVALEHGRGGASSRAAGGAPTRGPRRKTRSPQKSRRWSF
jgi:hypothetical protein